MNTNDPSQEVLSRMLARIERGAVAGELVSQFSDAELARRQQLKHLDHDQLARVIGLSSTTPEHCLSVLAREPDAGERITALAADPRVATSLRVAAAGRLECSNAARVAVLDDLHPREEGNVTVLRGIDDPHLLLAQLVERERRDASHQAGSGPRRARRREAELTLLELYNQRSRVRCNVLDEQQHQELIEALLDQPDTAVAIGHLVSWLGLANTLLTHPRAAEFGLEHLLEAVIQRGCGRVYTQPGTAEELERGDAAVRHAAEQATDVVLDQESHGDLLARVADTAPGASGALGQALHEGRVTLAAPCRSHSWGRLATAAAREGRIELDEFDVRCLLAAAATTARPLADEVDGAGFTADGWTAAVASDSLALRDAALAHRDDRDQRLALLEDVLEANAAGYHHHLHDEHDVIELVRRGADPGALYKMVVDAELELGSGTADLLGDPRHASHRLLVRCLHPTLWTVQLLELLRDGRYIEPRDIKRLWACDPAEHGVLDAAVRINSLTDGSATSLLLTAMAGATAQTLADEDCAALLDDPKVARRALDAYGSASLSRAERAAVLDRFVRCTPVAHAGVGDGGHLIAALVDELARHQASPEAHRLAAVLWDGFDGTVLELADVAVRMAADRQAVD